MHLHIGIARGILNKEQGKMKTTSLGNEILYYLSPSHSVSALNDVHTLIIRYNNHLRNMD